MEKENCLLIGILTKTYGIKGEFFCKLDNNFQPEDLNKPESVFVEIDNKLVPFFMSSCKRRNNSELIIKFDGIETISRNKLLIGKEIWVAKGDVLTNEDIDDSLRQYLGYKIHDKNHGMIGVFESILEFPGNPVMSVNNSGKEILLPLNTDFIENIDEATMTIYYFAPDGLIDLYL